MSSLKACAVVALWNLGKFDTMEIAHIVGLPEAEVERVIHIAREERRKRA